MIICPKSLFNYYPKMPFVWNDVNWSWIHDDEFSNAEKYKKFVVARTLFVTSSTPFLSKVSDWKFHKKLINIFTKQLKHYDFLFLE